MKFSVFFTFFYVFTLSTFLFKGYVIVFYAVKSNFSLWLLRIEDKIYSQFWRLFWISTANDLCKSIVFILFYDFSAFFLNIFINLLQYLRFRTFKTTFPFDIDCFFGFLNDFLSVFRLLTPFCLHLKVVLDFLNTPY